MIGAPVWYRLFQWLIIFQFFKEILLNNLGPHFQKKHIYHTWNAVENTKCIQSISKYFQCCISRTHWVLLMWMAVSCRKFIISSSQKQFSFLASQKQSLFSASQKQFLFSASQKHFLFLASPSQVPPSYFQCLSWGSKPSNILEYSLFVNIPIIILDDVIEAYNLSHFLSISISGIEFGVLNYFPFYFCHFSIITEDIFWSQLITLLFDVFFVVDIDAIKCWWWCWYWCWCLSDMRVVKKNYTTGFLGKKLYKQKVRKLWLFLLRMHKCIKINKLSHFYLQI